MMGMSGDNRSNQEIWLINYTGRKGGGPLDAISMTRALIDYGESVAAVVSSEVENLAEWKKLDLIKLVVIETYKNIADFLINSFLFPFRQKRQIKKELNGVQIDVIYCPMITFWTGSINRLFKDASTIEVLHDPIPHSGENKIISRSVEREIKKADIIAVHSKKYVDYVRKKYLKPVIWIPLGRHSEYSIIEKRDKGFDYEAQKTNFLFFGTFSKYKGLDILAEAFKKVENELGEDKCHIYIVGSGDFSPYRDVYEGITSCTVINRWIPDEEVESYFKGNNLVCVCPYVDGTQSGTVMLALEYQVPLIATDVGGIAEQIDDGETGVIIKPNDIEALYDAMMRMANDEVLRKAMVLNQESSLHKFDWSNSVSKLVDAANGR